MDYRFADFTDIPLLVEAASRLIGEQGLAERLRPAELERRFWDWLGGDCRAVIFEEQGVPAGYALYRHAASTVELKHFYVQQELRGGPSEREVFELLREEIWRPGVRVRVEAPIANEGSRRFWEEMGFRESAITLELDQAQDAARSTAAA